MKRLLLAFLLAWAGATGAAEDPALEKRLNTLAAELRCLVCQNQSLADSHADLAVDLKNQVRDMMRAGKSDDEIKSYLTQRYGEFVLYRPPVSGHTWLLWAGPFALLLAGVGLLVVILRRRQGGDTPATTAAPSDEEKARARALLQGPDATP